MPGATTSSGFPEPASVLLELDVDAAHQREAADTKGRRIGLLGPVVELLEDGKLRVRGGFTFKQTSFGIKPYSAGLGSIKVKDEVSFTFEAVATEVKEGAEKD